ncbi:hypothetical protein PR048_004146 [Dryococelus australis]|uniref:Uncharacterized protein n=1 Tax=Dryococelus australis TaxID=614101 RepID=A0ABQ9I4P0_9NEOP|nr:hypothetical protein PR048_004146 [Dryococelus australis]
MPGVLSKCTALLPAPVSLSIGIALGAEKKKNKLIQNQKFVRANLLREVERDEPDDIAKIPANEFSKVMKSFKIGTAIDSIEE